jgi:hypothetical protein
VTGVRAPARSTTPAAKRSAGHTRAPLAGAPPQTADTDTLRLLKHWRDAVPDDRFAHLVKDATRALFGPCAAACSVRVPFGHWAFLRILWSRTADPA